MTTTEQLPVVVAITGASGVVYGVRLLEILIRAGIEIHLVVSDSGRVVIQHELGLMLDLNRFTWRDLFPGVSFPEDDLRPVHVHHHGDFMAPVASGSHRTRGMVICPCSGSTLSGIAVASSRNLIQRAADVHLKERRPLVLVPRETPLSLTQIRNLETVSLAGATVLPASPGFYHGHQTVQDLIDFVVSRILDQLGLDNGLIQRWGDDPGEAGGGSDAATSRSGNS